MAAHSPDVIVKVFKKCHISNAMDGCCGMTVKRMGMLEVTVRKTKAMTVKMETVTLTGKSTQNLTCFVYVKGKVHPCTGTEALYRPYDP